MAAPSIIRDRPLRFALVGCGRIAQNHFAALKQHAARAELVAVCDNQPQALERAVVASGATGFASLDALLVGSDADIVIFDPARVRDRSTVEHPELISEGISWVIVGGQIALDPRGPRRTVLEGRPVRATP